MFTTEARNVFEVGDVVDLANVKAQHTNPYLDAAHRGLVVFAKDRRFGGRTYRVVTNDGCSTTMAWEESEPARLLGHIHLGLLFGGEQ